MLSKSALAAVAMALGASAAAIPLTVMAQAPAGPGAAASPAETVPMRPSRIEGRLAFLRTELKITEAQAPLWERVAAALRENERERREMLGQRPSRDGRPDALDRLAQRQKMAEAAAAAAARLRTALEPLYAAMTDEQKKEADALFGGRGPMGRGGPGQSGPRHH